MELSIEWCEAKLVFLGMLSRDAMHHWNLVADWDVILLVYSGAKPLLFLI